MADGTAKPVIFISYSHKDEPDKRGPDEVAWLTFVQSFLAPVVKVGIFDIWVDEHLHGGDALDPEIKKKLAACDIFVLLASRFSLASTYIVETEIATMRKRQRDGEDVRLYSIILSPVPDAALAQLKDLLLRPKDGKPLSLMSRNDREVAMAAIADDIAAVAKEIADKKRAAIEARTIILIESRKTVATSDRYSDPLFATRSRAFIDTSHLPETAYENLVGRDDKLKCLDDTWADDKTNILSLIAEGGAGKSALVNEWLKRLQADNYRGAEAVLGWSFYSQGTKERATSADEFLNWALDKLDNKLETTSTTAKGEAIAEAMMHRRVLLVLDGVEPLQHGLDTQLGQLKDQGLRALLRRFAATPPAQAHGLIVLTSRLPVTDIARWRNGAAPVVNVERLSEAAGAALLRDNGVWGTDKELKAAARDFEGHPLALGLLASFLKETQAGDVRRRDHIRAYFADPGNPRHDHANRVMESYEKEWLAGQPVLQAIMNIVGLFDRPASGDCLNALRAKPPIEGLTDQIVNLDDSEWQRAIARLHEVRLLAPADPSAPEVIDAHPLVREWFGDRLRQTNERAWKAAHGRLYEHLRDMTKEGDKPTLEDLASLYQAIAHGCRGGRHQNVLGEIYKNRICRRYPDGELMFYSHNILGAIGSDLAAISWLFEKPYEKPVSTLSELDKAWLLGEAGSNLRQQGRLEEALPALQAALQMGTQAETWLNAAIRACNLAEAQLLVGEIVTAVETAQSSIAFAERSGDKPRIMICQTAHANSLQAAGRRDEAEILFADAERRQRELQSRFPLLYSVRGWEYCDLLLSKGDYGSAQDRASRTFEWVKNEKWLLDMGLDELTIGRANLGLALTPDGRERDERHDRARRAGVRLEEAVHDLHAAGTIDFIPCGVLSYATYRRTIGDWDGAARDLDEVEEIAETGPMRLYLCDMALERGRLAFAKIEAFAPLNGMLEEHGLPKPTVPSVEQIVALNAEAEKQIKIAADLIEKCGYHRRDEELAELQAVLRGEKKFAELPPRV